MNKIDIRESDKVTRRGKPRASWIAEFRELQA
jgi:hypothetical protein